MAAMITTNDGYIAQYRIVPVIVHALY
jgi:intraflagellar transport protein 122